MTKPNMKQIDNWFAKVRFTPDCWEWLGCKHLSGHGLFRVGSKSIGAYRVAYEWFVGPVPAGLHLDHVCRNPGCVNPKHLEPVTRGENLRRALVARTHCKRGHAYAEGNLITRREPSGKIKRGCLTCHKAAMVSINRKWNAFYAAQNKKSIS